jgi:hypothetical protein
VAVQIAKGFMLRKAVSCKKPGYTRRMKPAWGNGTWLTRFLSNHSMGLLLASSLTAVGLTRQSTGPAISVRLWGWAGWSSSAMMAVAAKAATQGWHTATQCVRAPESVVAACANSMTLSM